MCTKRAMTLIELLAVVTLVALLAGVVVVRLGSPYRRALYGHAVAEFQEFEAQLRSHAQRLGRPVLLAIDLDSGVFNRLDIQRQKPLGPPTRLVGGVRIDRVVTAAGLKQFGGVETVVSAQGQTDSYAVRLKGPGDRSVWLMFAGLSGQVTRAEDESEIEEIFRMLSPSRVHAD